MPNDPMGKGHVHQGGGSLTEDAFKHMAQKWGMSEDEVKKNVYELLKKEFEQNSKK